MDCPGQKHFLERLRRKLAPHTMHREIAVQKARIAELIPQINHQTALVAELREQINNQMGRREQGLTIDVAYPCNPRVRTWTREKNNDFCRRIIAKGDDRYAEELKLALAMLEFFSTISMSEPIDERLPWWMNPWFPSLDAISLTYFLRKLNPRGYVEVGSGNSTKYVRHVIAHYGLRTKVTSIDPYPRAEIDVICDNVIRSPLEECDLSLFRELGAEDLVFIDNSHLSLQNSDVTVFFTEVLPMLQSGCHYGIHDIFLPDDYPTEWFERRYNEQYLLMSYLLGGADGDEIVLPVHYVKQVPELLKILDPVMHLPALGGADPAGGCFWMRRR